MSLKNKIRMALALFPALCAVSFAAEPVIIIPEMPAALAFPPGETVCYAAEFLRFHIEAATGKKLEILPESEAERHPVRIWIGNTRFAAKNLKEISFHPEELLIRSLGNDLILCGETTADGLDRGTLFAVYEYLERALGIRWFFADIPQLYPNGLGTEIPESNELKLTGWDIREFPRCRQREGGISYYYEPAAVQKLWHPVLRFGSSRPHRNANHTQINWYNLYHQTHPEYFAKNAAGKTVFNTRLPHRNYICPGETGVLAQMIQNIADADAGKPPEKAWGPCPPEKNYVYFAFNDGMTLPKTCHCSTCIRLLRPDAPEAGQASELVFDFIRRYAEAIQIRWPERSLVTLAFHHYRKPPEKSAIPDNVNVTYVSKYMHYANHPARWEEETSYIREWSRLLKNDPDRLRIWLNIVAPAQYTSQVPLFYPHLFRKWLRANLQYSDSYFINGLNPYLKRLNAAARRKAIATYPMVYLQSRLLWNPDADIDALLEDYTRKLYGPAGKTMREIYRIFCERWEKFAMQPDADEAGYIHSVRYPPDIIAQINALFAQTVSETEEDSVYRRRVELFRNHQWVPFMAEAGQPPDERGK